MRFYFLFLGRHVCACMQVCDDVCCCDAGGGHHSVRVYVHRDAQRPLQALVPTEAASGYQGHQHRHLGQDHRGARATKACAFMHIVWDDT